MEGSDIELGSMVHRTHSNNKSVASHDDELEATPPPDLYEGSNASIDKSERAHVIVENTDTTYSYFNNKYKTLLVVQCAFTGFYSAIAGAIYYPVLNIIEKDFHINEEQVNITVVVYFIFQGVAPSIMGGLADTLGRRPVVLTSVMLYFVACIGLARSNTYGQILGLRCLQAAGIAPVIAINSGIMGDVTTKAERGGYVGYVSGFMVIGSALGALIGALLANRWGWRSIFWFLVIGSGICGMCSFVILAETKRTVVGNGSVTPRSMLNYAPVLRLKAMRNMLHLDHPEMESLEPRVKVNLFAPVAVLKNPKLHILLFVAGLQFSTWSTHQTALSTVLSSKYNMKVLDIGLCYLPTGLCTMVSVICSGRYLNWVYLRASKRHTLWYDEQIRALAAERGITEKAAKEVAAQDPHYNMNLFDVRLRAGFYTLMLSNCGYIAYGWCIQVKAPLAAVLVCSGFASLFSNCILTFSTTTMVDLFPSKGSTATSCLNLYRCLLSALFIGCLSRMVNKINYGGVFTLMGAANIVSSFMLFYLIKHGKRIAFERSREEAEMMEAARAAEASKKQSKEENKKDAAVSSDVEITTIDRTATPERIV